MHLCVYLLIYFCVYAKVFIYLFAYLFVCIFAYASPIIHICTGVSIKQSKKQKVCEVGKHNQQIWRNNKMNNGRSYLE